MSFKSSTLISIVYAHISKYKCISKYELAYWTKLSLKEVEMAIKELQHKGFILVLVGTPLRYGINKQKISNNSSTENKKKIIDNYF
jgi:hypothetical protein